MALSFSQFKSKHRGKFVEYHSFDPRAKNQCVDLVNQYFVDVLQVPAIIGTNAVDFPKKIAPPVEIVEETPTTVPEVGWVVVFKQYGSLYGSPGHIGVVDEKTDINNLYVFEQNYPTGSPCVTNRHNYRGVLCYLKVKSTTGTMPEDPLQECLKQHKDLINQLEAEKRKTAGLQEQVVALEAEKNRLSGEVAEKASALKTVRDELSQFIEALATRLTTIADKSEVIGAVDRLISGESEHLKKIKELERAYDDLVDRKHDEIEALKRSITELKEVNERQAKHISTLETRLTNLEHDEVKQRSLFEVIQELIERIKQWK